MQYAYSSTTSESQEQLDGHSFPLCAKIVEALFTRPENFHVQTLFVLGHNTRRDSEGNAYRIFHGLVVNFNSMIPISLMFCLCLVHANKLIPA